MERNQNEKFCYNKYHIFIFDFFSTYTSGLVSTPLFRGIGLGETISL